MTSPPQEEQREGDDLDQAIEIFEQGKASHDAEDFEGALALYRDALTIQESSVGRYHEDTGKTYWSMGWSSHLLHQGKGKEQQHPQHVETKVEGGRLVSFHQQQQEAAVSFFQTAWKISRRLYGDSHGSTALVLDDLQDVLSGELGLSASQVKDFCETMNTISAMEHDGDENYINHRLHRALRVYTKALSLQEEAVQSIHHRQDSTMNRRADVCASRNLEVADLSCKIAVIMKQLGNQEGAYNNFCKALAVYESMLGRNHPTTLDIYRSIYSLPPLCNDDDNDDLLTTSTRTATSIFTSSTATTVTEEQQEMKEIQFPTKLQDDSNNYVLHPSIEIIPTTRSRSKRWWGRCGLPMERRRSKIDHYAIYASK